MRRWAIAIILVFLGRRAVALTAGELLPDPDRRSAVLVTIGLGGASYEAFGHNAIWLHDPTNEPTDVLYNYGVFDLYESHFVWHFIQGLMEYRIERVDEVYGFLNFYASQDRTLRLQELDLAPEQFTSLSKFLAWNALPENQKYRYNYYTNNCSTKVRDAIDGVIEHQIQLQTSVQESGTTFRWHTRRLAGESLPLYAGLDYMMGHPIDRPITVWEEMFLPVRLSVRLRDVTLQDARGSMRPLVRWEKEIYTSKSHREPVEPPNWFGVFLAIGLGIGGLLALGGWLLARAGPWRTFVKVVVCLVAMAWVMLAGLGGVISSFAWFFTDHYAARYNENLMQLNPITLPLIVLVPIAIFSQRRGRTGASYLAVMGLALSILGFILQILPNWIQPNAEIIALALPAHAGLAWVMYRLYLTRTRQEVKIS